MDVLRRALPERVVGHLVDRGADHGKPRGQGPLPGEVVEGRQQLAPAKVPRRAEDDHHRRVRDPVVVQAFREWVRGLLDLHFSGGTSPLTTAWHPNCGRIMASIRSPNVFSMRLRKRAKRDSVMTGAGTDSSIAASTVHRPSPVSWT